MSSQESTHDKETLRKILGDDFVGSSIGSAKPIIPEQPNVEAAASSNLNGKADNEGQTSISESTAPSNTNTSKHTKHNQDLTSNPGEVARSDSKMGEDSEPKLPTEASAEAVAALPPAARPARTLTMDELAKEVYISGFPKGIQESALQEFLNLLLRDHPDIKPLVTSDEIVTACKIFAEGNAYAFIDVSTADVATKLVKLTNQIYCLGQPLRTGRPKRYYEWEKSRNNHTKDHTTKPVVLERVQREIGLHVDHRNSNTASVSESLVATLKRSIEEQEQANTPSSKLLLANMIVASTLDDAAEMKSIEEDVREELSSMGSIVSLQMPTSRDDLRILVEMSSTEEAIRIREKLQGRTFDRRKIHIIFTA